ncbi:hypothetical protein Cgig2_014584 [Carnegiea gigantea]|uniref:Uncharacterized protein n=1 Tax=Carnegiea gigantea TaxID=171969 RepID=A0A9Q1QTC5_9CARY|nr:hypothetical protein Cgig2_014584 [Carnegiea gigantea]
MSHPIVEPMIEKRICCGLSVHQSKRASKELCPVYSEFSVTHDFHKPCSTRHKQCGGGNIGVDELARPGRSAGPAQMEGVLQKGDELDEMGLLSTRVPYTLGGSRGTTPYPMVQFENPSPCHRFGSFDFKSMVTYLVFLCALHNSGVLISMVHFRTFYGMSKSRMAKDQDLFGRWQFRLYRVIEMVDKMDHLESAKHSNDLQRWGADASV